MDVKEKLRKLSFVKNQMMKEGPENINDVEPTICQIFEDVFGIGSEYTKSLIKYRDKIFKSCYNGGKIVIEKQRVQILHTILYAEPEIFIPAEKF